MNFTNRKMEQIIKRMRAFGDSLKNNREKARQFMIDAGILTKNGELSPNYYSEEEIKADKKRKEQ